MILLKKLSLLVPSVELIRIYSVPAVALGTLGATFGFSKGFLSPFVKGVRGAKERKGLRASIILEWILDILMIVGYN